MTKRNCYLGLISVIDYYSHIDQYKKFNHHHLVLQYFFKELSHIKGNVKLIDLILYCIQCYRVLINVSC